MPNSAFQQIYAEKADAVNYQTDLCHLFERHLLKHLSRVSTPKRSFKQEGFSIWTRPSFGNLPIGPS